MSDKNIVDAFAEYTRQQIEAKRERFNSAIRDTLLRHFGITSYDQAIKKFAGKKISLAYNQNHEFFGIIVNNRWLYAVNGQVIGKQGKIWKMEV